jgi:hypothetical protein
MSGLTRTYWRHGRQNQVGDFKPRVAYACGGDGNSSTGGLRGAQRTCLPKGGRSRTQYALLPDALRPICQIRTPFRGIVTSALFTRSLRGLRPPNKRNLRPCGPRCVRFALLICGSRRTTEKRTFAPIDLDHRSKSPPEVLVDRLICSERDNGMTRLEFGRLDTVSVVGRSCGLALLAANARRRSASSSP